LERIESAIERMGLDRVSFSQFSHDLGLFPGQSPHFAQSPTDGMRQSLSGVSSPKDCPLALCHEGSFAGSFGELDSGDIQGGHSKASLGFKKHASDETESVGRRNSTGGTGVLTKAKMEKRSCAAGEVARALKDRQELLKLRQSRRGKTQTCGPRWLRRIMRLVDWFEHLEEPRREGWLASIVKSQRFETLCSFVILLNAGFVAYTADQAMKHVGERPVFFIVSTEIVFTAVYTLELLLRISVHRIHFFVNDQMRWNWLDFVLVLMSIADTMSELLIEGGHKGNVGFMRMLRICKLAKVLRAFRAMRFFKELAIMLNSFRHTMTALFWSFVMLVFMLYIFAVLFLQGMTHYLAEEGKHLDANQQRQIAQHFGSMADALFSLYSAATGGDDWAVYYRVVKKSGGAYAGLFIFFTGFFTFAVFNIITGFFVEKAVSAATPDRDDMILASKLKARETAKEFRHLCSVLDQDQTGTITWKDFERHMQNEVMVAYMASIGLEVHEVELFFRVVAGAAAGEISIERFVDGCMQMKGAATGIDMQRQLFEMHLLADGLAQFERATLASLQQCKASIEELMSPMKSRRFAGTSRNRNAFVML
jgi:hypothetical protein